MLYLYYQIFTYLIICYKLFSTAIESVDITDLRGLVSTTHLRAVIIAVISIEYTDKSHSHIHILFQIL